MHLFSFSETNSIFDIKSQCVIIYSSENFSFSILFPFSIYELVNECLWPVISSGIELPKYIDIAISDEFSKLILKISVYISSPFLIVISGILLNVIFLIVFLSILFSEKDIYLAMDKPFISKLSLP